MLKELIEKYNVRLVTTADVIEDRNRQRDKEKTGRRRKIRFN